ncbi:MAG: SGNH/GDSL hydrolase family protein [Bacteroidota bacterium]
MNIKYLAGSIVALPLLPLMYVQGKRIRSGIPDLPEATGNSGSAGSNTESVLKMLVIGESTIAGIGVKTHEEGFTGTLAKILAEKTDTTVDWRVYARSGYTVERVSRKIIPKIEEKEADLIVVGLGGNDAFTLNNPKRWGRQLMELINELRSKFGEIPIFFTNMPPIKEFPAFTPVIKYVVGNLVEILGDELERVSKSQGNVFYSAEKITIGGWTKKFNIEGTAKDFFSDGVHPSKLTYQVWARDFAGFMIESSDRIRIKQD